MRNIALILGLALCVFYVVPAGAQIPPPQHSLTVTLDSLDNEEPPSVRMAVTVAGSNGEGMLGLNSSNFKINPVSGAGSTITPIVSDFEDSEIGVSIVLCLDASGSMEGRSLQNMQDAICSFIDSSLRPQDYLSIITFADSYSLVAPFSNDKTFLKNAVRNISVSGNKSSLFYGVYKSIEELQKRGNTLERRFVVVISDGNDNVNIYDINTCVEKANQENVAISTIGFTNQDEIYLQNLEALSDRTGGKYHYGANSSSELGNQLDASITLLNSQYLLMFTLPSGRETNEYELTVTTRNFQGSMNFTVDMPQYECLVCHELFNTQYELENHMENEHEGEVYICEYCGDEFSDYDAYNIHIDAEHTFECSYCDTTIVGTQADLDSHIDDTYFVCPECDRAFDSQADLDEHSSIHESGPPWLLILIGLVVIGGGTTGIILFNKKAAKEREAVRRDIEEREAREKELKEKTAKLEREAAVKKSEAEKKEQASSDQTPVQQQGPRGTQVAAQQEVRGTVIQGTDQPRQKRKTMIGGSTVYMSASLIVISGPNKGVQYNLNTSEITIGRLDDNVISIQNDAVSGHHAVIRSGNGQYQLFDLDSTNGTFVNGKRISNVLLQSGNLIRLGPDVELKFQGN